MSKPKKEKKILYKILRPTVYAAVNTFYKVNALNTEHADTNKPTLIIANHTNAVIDPLVIVFSLIRATYFLPRGDVFNSGFKRWIFNQFNMIPIFRKEEGKENRHKNEETFKKIYSLFDLNKLVVIYAEGSCVQEKRVRPFRKGTSKIAFEYAQHKNSDSLLQFVPVGQNYHDWNRFDSYIWLEFGEPFTLKDANIDPSLSEAEQHARFSDFANEKLKKLVIAIDDADFNGLEIELIKLYSNDLCNTLNGQLDEAEVHLDVNKRLSKAINKASTQNKEWLVDFYSSIKEYQNLLKNIGLRNINVINPQSYGSNIIKLISILISSPLFIVGFLLNGIQFIYPLKFANKKVKFIYFAASTRVVLSYILFLISYLLYYVIFSLIIKSFSIGIAIIPTTYLLGLFARNWWVKLKHVLGDFNYLSLKSSKSPVFEKMTTLKQIIDDKFNYFKIEYYQSLN